MILLSPINGNNAICDVCSKHFKRKAYLLKKQDTHCCSLKCRNDYKKSLNTIECVNCGKEFYKVKSHAQRVTNNFCSRECSTKYNSGENHHHYNQEVNNRKCKECGTKTKNKKFCSFDCRAKYMSRENHHRYNRVDIKCSSCGCDIKKIPSLIHSTNFCSQKCKNKFHSKRMSGDNNARFKHGDWVGVEKAKLLYKGFTLKLKKKVRDRDKNTCQVCGKTKENHGMNMHVHHIDYNKDNNEMSNLICVCRYCHGKIHGNESLWEKILSKK